MDAPKTDMPIVTVDEAVHLADLAREAEAWERALAWLGVALEMAPTSARLWEARGRVLNELSRVDEAVLSFNKATRFGNTGEAQLLSALALIRAGRRDKAALHIEDALTRSPGLALHVAGDPELAPLIESECSTAFRAAVQDLRA